MSSHAVEYAAVVPDEVPRPRITKVCKGCRASWHHVEANKVIVSRNGVAHIGRDFGMTVCGTDATGDRWWWPL